MTSVPIATIKNKNLLSAFLCDISSLREIQSTCKLWLNVHTTKLGDFRQILPGVPIFPSLFQRYSSPVTSRSFISFSSGQKDIIQSSQSVNGLYRKMKNKLGSQIYSVTCAKYCECHCFTIIFFPEALVTISLLDSDKLIGIFCSTISDGSTERSQRMIYYAFWKFWI